MGARLLTVGEGDTNMGRKKARINPVVLDLNSNLISQTLVFNTHMELDIQMQEYRCIFLYYIHARIHTHFPSSLLKGPESNDTPGFISTPGTLILVAKYHSPMKELGSLEKQLTPGLEQ